MNRLRPAIAAAAAGAIALVVGVTAIGSAATTGSTATCDPSPTLSAGPSSQDFTLNCSVPNPPPTTVTATETTTATATATATVTVPGPTVTATTTVTAAPTPLPYVGAAEQGNGDPSALESYAGRVLGVHRTYWNLNASGSNNYNLAITQAKDDAAHGRVAWESFKLPTGVTWAQAANGQVDSVVKSLNTQLDAVPGPVWVAIHHEPEGDGTLSDWVKMQQHLLPLLNADNVRTSIILTGYDTYYSGNSAYSVSSLWPGSMCDILGLDIYNPPTGWREMKDVYAKVAPDAKARNVDWAIAETAYTDEQAAQDPDWLTRAFDDMKDQPTQPGLALSYFDSTLNSGTNSWPLGTGVKRDKFVAILKRSHPPL